jgi:predicted NBD/HSP70 family sugar kinase
MSQFTNATCYTRKYMYIGIDVGGPKTLVASLDGNGVITEQVRYPTPQDYSEFLTVLSTTLQSFKVTDFVCGGIGIPVTVFDRQSELAMSFGNLPWKDVAVQQDVEKICHCPVAVENDAKLAGLSEAMLLKEEFHKVLYVTVSTGIGFSFINHEKIDTNMGDSGGHDLLIEYEGKLTPWESFASGHAIVDRFGKKAADINDTESWRIISHDLSKGLVELVALTEPEVIVIGGSVGTYFNKYGGLLQAELEKYNLPLLKMPVIRGAQRAEEAVIYGCYDLAKQMYPDARTSTES